MSAELIIVYCFSLLRINIKIGVEMSFVFYSWIVVNIAVEHYVDGMTMLGWYL